MRATKYTSYNGRQIALSIGQSLVDDGWDGYAILDIPRKALAALMSEYDSAYISDIVLIDRNNVVAYSQTGRIEEGVTLKDPELLAMLEVPEGEVRGNSGCVRVLEESGLKLLITADNRFIRPLIVGMLAGLAAIVALSLGIAATSGALLSKRISSQMEQLLEVCRKGPSSEFQEKYVPMRGDFQEIVRIGEHLNAMNGQVRELISKIQDKQRILATAELNLLKAQMRPHFIYNVLNDIKAMAKLGKTREIAELVVCFGALMRNTLSVDEEFSTVSEELDLVEKYIQMQNLRGIRPISLRIQVCEALMQQEVPRLILQPLVENAVCHGLPGVDQTHPSSNFRMDRRGKDLPAGRRQRKGNPRSRTLQARGRHGVSSGDRAEQHLRTAQALLRRAGQIAHREQKRKIHKGRAGNAKKTEKC